MIHALPTILRGDARALALPDESVDLIVTSPPYFGLRSYQDGGEHYDGQIGSEATPQEFIAALVECTREWMRVLKPSGSIFVNLGDKYSTGNSGQSGMAKLGEQYRGGGHTDAKAKQRSGRVRGMPPKSLLLLPERYRIACVDELGLIARAVIVWSKPNGLPESVTDRVRRSHEDWVHLTRSPRYFAAVDEIREPHTMKPQRRPHGRPEDATPRPTARQAWSTLTRSEPGFDGNPLGKLPGSVWEIATQPLKVPAELGIDHFAAFPMEWPRRLITGWCPREVCTVCGEGRRPVAARGALVSSCVDPDRQRLLGGDGQKYDGRDDGGERLRTAGGPSFAKRERTITGYACACTPYIEHEGDEHGKPWREYLTDTPHPSTTPGVVLDPFGGTGTTALVATMLGRTGISVDLSADYARLAEWRAADPKERARAAGLDPDAVAQVHHQVPGQESLLDLLGDAS